MALRHALLVTLLDGAATGYELSKRFDVAAANFWHSQPAQLYAELAHMEADGLVEATTVVQDRRPNKRVLALTDDGMAAIRAYVAEPSDPASLKDELLVKVTAADIADPNVVLADVARRRAASVAKLARYEASRHAMLHGRDEATFVRTTRRVGPYLTLLRGIALERETIDWCDAATRIVAARARQRPRGARAKGA